MTEVWISGVYRNLNIGVNDAIRAKYYGHDWEPATNKAPLLPDEVYAAFKRHIGGHALERHEFPEAVAVFNPGRFRKRRELFYAGAFFCVEGRLAETLARVDVGDGGLIPFTIYEDDLVTPLKSDFFLLNLGAIKEAVVPEQSRNVQKLAVDKATGRQYWKVSIIVDDDDVVVDPSALMGADIWCEPYIPDWLFMKDSVVQALESIGMADVFELKRCRVDRR